MEGNRPFLSVIMRTQGKRPEALQEALLCMYAQTDMDFEICLMAHKVAEADMQSVISVVESMPEILRDRIRVLTINHGGRTAPLSEGFQAAKGEYVVAFDDDDLVFDHWVETFHKMQKEHSGKLLHTYCIQQNWIKEFSPYEEDCYTAQGRLEATYCTDFEFVRQLCKNYCPIHSVAFPTTVYQEKGIRFDEGFEVTEDWDFLMRAAMVCEVANCAEVTSLYRIWENYENSKTLNEEQIWEDNKKKILDKLDANPLVLPRGSASKIVEYIEQNPMNVRNKESGQKLWMQMFFDIGNGYNEKDSTHLWASTKNSVYCGKTTEVPKHIKTLRIDPGEMGMLVLENASVLVTTCDGQQIVKQIEACNGYSYESYCVFLDDDPQLYVELDEIDGIESLQFASGYTYQLKSELFKKIIHQHIEEECEKRSTFAYRKAQMKKKILGKE